MTNGNVKKALFVRLESKPGREAEVKDFLDRALPLVIAEELTPLWFSLRLSDSTFGIFDCFFDKNGRDAHLQGPLAAALMSKAEELFVRPPQIERLDVLGAKA
jgi:quinol monooxygenase YgiN